MRPSVKLVCSLINGPSYLTCRLAGRFVLDSAARLNRALYRSFAHETTCGLPDDGRPAGDEVSTDWSAPMWTTDSRDDG
jgi:hypothetical protein